MVLDIRTIPLPVCSLCGGKGDALYTGLQDRLFGAPGLWNLKQCCSRDCGLVWLDPMPVEEDLWQAYQDYYTHHGRARRKAWWQAINQRVTSGYHCMRYSYPCSSPFDRLLGLIAYMHPGRRSELDFRAMHLKARPGARLLEIGCGSGDVLAEMAECGWKAEGLDLDPVAVEHARSRGLQVHLGALADQRFPDRHFDAVVMNHLIEHVYDPVALLRECWRILGDGGTIVIVTPNTASLGHRLYKRNWRELDPPRHLHLFAEPAMRRLLRQAGLAEAFRIFTSIREANSIYLAFGDLKRFGRHTMGSGKSRYRRLLGRLFQLGEWLANLFSGRVGEELVVIVRKGSGER